MISEHRRLMEAVIARDPASPQLLAEDFERTCRVVVGILQQSQPERAKAAG
jgi:DNA-binding GntR family transcriptional regulator